MAPDREAKSNMNNFNTKEKKTNEEKQVCVSTYKFEHLNLNNSFLIRLRCGVMTVQVCGERLMYEVDAPLRWVTQSFTA